MAGTLGIATLETGVDTKGLDKGLDQSKKKTQSFTDQVKQGFSTAIGFGVADAVTMATQAVVQFVQDSVVEFQTFENQANEVFTLLPQFSGQARDQMKVDILDFSTEVGRTTDEVIPALY